MFDAGGTTRGGHFLSGNTLELMSDMRRQFAELLHAIGFLPDGARTADHVDASHNRHARDVSMLRAVICAGMYPRLVSIRKRGKRNELATHEDGKVECHPGSVNSVFGTNFPFPWLVYGEKIKTSGVYVRDSTCVPAYAALLLGGDFETDAEGATPTLQPPTLVNPPTLFNRARRGYQDMRRELHVQRAATRPDPDTRVTARARSVVGRQVT